MGVIENRIDITELERSGGGGGGGTAASVSYDNTSSGLTATTVQGAIDEVVAESAGKDQISNRNLLDNPFFTVNQRDLTSYTTNGYTVDRWSVNNGITCGVTDGGITITHPDNTTNANFLQYYESDRLKDVVGKKVTVSVMTSDGTIYKQTGEVPTIESESKVVTRFTLGETDFSCDLIIRLTKPFITIYSSTANATISIKAIKLEIGSVSTLDMDAAPNYAEELLKCQRYFQRLTTMPGRSYAPIGTGIVASNTGVRLFVPLIAPLRGVPSVSFNTDEGKIDLFGADTSNRIPVTNITFNQFGNNSIILTITVESLQSYIEIGDACECWIMNSTAAYIDLSADL